MLLFVAAAAAACAMAAGLGFTPGRTSTDRARAAWEALAGGKVREARELYLAELKIRPDDPRVLRGLAIAAREAGNDEEALGYWERLCAVTTGDEAALAWKQRGLAELRLGRSLEALSSLQTALSLLPQGETDPHLSELISNLVMGTDPLEGRPDRSLGVQPPAGPRAVPRPTPPDPLRHLPRRTP
jgi:tetratricopeptide (TPR) repeat protein